MKFIPTYLIVLIFLASCQNSNSNDSTYSNGGENKSAEQLKDELEDKESSTPLSFLSYKNVQLTPRQKKIKRGGIFREAEYALDGGEITGYITSSASVARYKDVSVKVSFYSGTQSLIDEQYYTIYEFIEPNKKLYFTLNIESIPQAYKTFSFEITKALSLY